MGVVSVNIEKTSFVLEHWDLVDKNDRDAMPGSNDSLKTGDENVAKRDAATRVEEVAKEASEDDTQENTMRQAAKKPEAGKRVVKRGTPESSAKVGKEEENDIGTRRSKRTKK